MSDDLSEALRKLAAEWKTLAQKAEHQGQQLGVGNIQQAYYQRGIAEGLRRAQVGVKKLLDPPKVATPVERPEPEEYMQPDREAVLALLIRSGFRIHELHNHSDNSYTLMLTTLQAVSYEDELERLAAAPNIVILAHGKLPNSTKTYIDFAFRKSRKP